MDPPRWPVIAALAVVGVLLAAGGWAIGRSGKSNGIEGRSSVVASDSIHLSNGVLIGVLRTRGGALAAADNYVAQSSQTVVKDPAAYSRLIRKVWVADGRAQALSEGERARRLAPEAVQNYAEGGQAISVVAARRLESYDGVHATVLTWGGGFVWGPHKKPTQRWFLATVQLAWSGGLWRVQALDELERAAPSPYQVVVGQSGADSSHVFDRALRRMTAPIYGTVETAQ